MIQNKLNDGSNQMLIHPVAAASFIKLYQVNLFYHYFGMAYVVAIFKLNQVNAGSQIQGFVWRNWLPLCLHPHFECY